MFKRAIVKPPSKSFPFGITTSNLGAPDYRLALRQHEAYCKALEKCGLLLTRLEPTLLYPDSTFVEDTAIVTSSCAVIMRPGAVKRRGEVPAIANVIPRFFERMDTIQPPGRIDGGDICQIETHFFIGLSKRTNKDGARQLTAFLEANGFTASNIELNKVSGLLHLKSGLAYLGDGQVLVTKALARHPAFKKFEVTVVPSDEEYAANCIRVNDYVLIAAGFSKVKELIERLGYKTLELEMSEFQKMDGGLSCLSLRF